MNQKHSLSNYHYDLPEEKIAKHPAKNRDDSKLLLYNGEISHKKFKEIDQLLPEDCTLVFNNTKVIPARLIFTKTTGAHIEVFLQNPVSPYTEMSTIMTTTEECTWECIIGNSRRWKEQELQIETNHFTLTAKRSNDDKNLVVFNWNSKHTFAEVLEYLGKVPLPPYFKREQNNVDKERYQTVYSKLPGAVAAPTAGLHFTKDILDKLESKFKIEYVTLHVGSGTFQPVKTDNYTDHNMHAEVFVVDKKTIENVANAKKIIAVGTTSLRTLESLYWYGSRLHYKENRSEIEVSPLSQNDMNISVSVAEAYQNILKYGYFSEGKIKGRTSIFIYPGYKFRVIKGLVTNFHLPGSTLILLIATLIGDDWKKIYDEALKKGYRFLSYGDSSLLLP